MRATAQGHKPTAAAATATTATGTAVAAEGAHLEGDTRVSAGDVAAARQQLQGGVTELGARAGERTLRQTTHVCASDTCRVACSPACW